jgi:hypothetical protein
MTHEVKPTDSVRDGSTRLTDQSLRTTFRRLADTWIEETGDSSFVQKKVRHPAYQQIIELGPDAVPLILHDLEDSPAHWFWALAAITGENPVKPGATFREAVAAWLAWGRERGLIE